jgi:hypothetical protein
MKTGVHVGPCSGRLAPAWQERSGPRPAQRPRRMGLCSEVAGGGGNLEDHPALANRYVCRKSPFQQANCPAKFASGALNLSHPVQTKPCLGHCITRGIGLRRQATIFRLRGAVLSAGLAREFGRASGVRTHTARRFRRARAAIYQQMENGTLWFRSGYCGGVRVAISTLDQVGKDRGKVRPCRACFAFEDRSRTDVRNAPTDVLD